MQYRTGCGGRGMPLPYDGVQSNLDIWRTGILDTPEGCPYEGGIWMERVLRMYR